jgi:hypothetical protein
MKMIKEFSLNYVSSKIKNLKIKNSYFLRNLNTSIVKFNNSAKTNFSPDFELK